MGSRISRYMTGRYPFFRIGITVLLIAMLACFPLLVSGYPYGTDWLLEIVRVIEFRESLAGGQVFPYWAYHQYGGLGSPVFVYYPPLYLYLVNLGMVVGLGLLDSMTASLLFLTAAAAAGYHGLVREITGHDDVPAYVALAIYVFSPYMISDVILRNASAEYTALCLLPYAAWGMVRVCKNKAYGVYLLSAGFALVILSHNIVALVAAYGLTVTSILVFLHARSTRTFLYSLLGIFIGVGLTAWFWLPALIMKQYVNIDDLVTGQLSISNNYPALSGLVGYGDIYSMGIVFPVLLIVAIHHVLSTGSRNKLILLYLLLHMLVFIALLFPVSDFIWRSVPLMEYFQFPFRILGPLSFLMALVAGLVFAEWSRRSNFKAAVIVLLVIINAVPVLSGYEGLPKELVEEQNTVFSPDNIRNRGYPVTVLDEYLPLGADVQYASSRISGRLIYGIDEDRVDYYKSETGRHGFVVTVRDPVVVEVSRFYYPVWKADINNNAVPVTSSGSGMVALRLQPGKNDVELWLSQPYMRSIGFAISIIVVLLSVAGAYRSIRYRPVNTA